MQAAVGQIPWLLHDAPVVGSDRFYKRRYQIHHAFELTEADWVSLESAVNARAKRRII